MRLAPEHLALSGLPGPVLTVSPDATSLPISSCIQLGKVKHMKTESKYALKRVEKKDGKASIRW